MVLHALRHFNAQQAHARLDDFGHCLAERQAHGTLLLVGLLQNLEVVVETVEFLCQVVSIVGYYADIVVRAGLRHCFAEG